MLEIKSSQSTKWLVTSLLAYQVFVRVKKCHNLLRLTFFLLISLIKGTNLHFPSIICHSFNIFCHLCKLWIETVIKAKQVFRIPQSNSVVTWYDFFSVTNFKKQQKLIEMWTLAYITYLDGMQLGEKMAEIWVGNFSAPWCTK